MIVVRRTRDVRIWRLQNTLPLMSHEFTWSGAAELERCPRYGHVWQSDLFACESICGQKKNDRAISI